MTLKNGLTKHNKVMLLAGLGLCEHCGELMSFEDMPPEAMDADWRCHKCGGVLTDKSFGYGKVNGKLQKVKWVGPDKTWVTEKPAENFELGSWYITIRPISPIL
jgi:NAD-dependent SIR2 family protein deacetylase